MQRRRGRPLKARIHLKSARKQYVLERLRKYHLHKRSKREQAMDRLSTLERLPVELIQQIFFHALEVNMPRASKYLQQVLSTQPIFHGLITLAYFDDDGVHPVEVKHFLPAEYRQLDCEEKVRLQQGIFSCRWCTYARILSCMPALSRLAMVQAWYSEKAQNESYTQGVDNTDTTPTVANESIRAIAPLPEKHDEVRLEQHFLARLSIEDLESLGSNKSLQHKRTEFLPRIVTWAFSLDDHGIIHKGVHKSPSILAARCIPDWLLSTTSWTQQHLSLLQLLRQGYAFIQDDHVMSISAKAVFEGARNAIRRADTVALKTFLEIHNSFFRSGTWSIQTMLGPQLTPPSYHPLPVDLFHLAVQQADKATDSLALLLRAGIDALPNDDEIVTAWAVHESRIGNTLASWLLKHMEGTPNYGLPRRVNLFVDGSFSWRARTRNNGPFPETTFAMELGYLPQRPIVPAGLYGKACGYDET